jgi:HlyD family secretion protein
VRIEAFPDRPLSGGVREVSAVPLRSDPRSSDSVNLYPAVVSVKESPPGWKPGMSAVVTIFTESEGLDCLAVPVRAIVGGAEMGDRRRVHVWSEDGPVAREVVVGRSDDRLAEIVSGLSEGERVVVNPSELTSEP